MFGIRPPLLTFLCPPSLPFLTSFLPSCTQFLTPPRPSPPCPSLPPLPYARFASTDAARKTEGAERRSGRILGLSVSARRSDDARMEGRSQKPKIRSKKEKRGMMTMIGLFTRGKWGKSTISYFFSIFIFSGKETKLFVFLYTK